MNLKRAGLLATFLLLLAAFAAAQSTNSTQAASPGNAQGASSQQVEPGQQHPVAPNAMDTQNSSSPAAAPLSSSGQNNGMLQSRIADALRNEPTLGSSHVSVNVADSSIDLTGTVGSGKDRQTAERIAQSFDGNRKLNDKLVVTGRGHSDLAPEHPAVNNSGTGNAPNPATNNPNNTPPR